MNKEQSFKLLHLPILAIQECIRSLTVFQFLDFSLLSKRTKFIASTIHREKIQIHFSIGPHPRLYLTLPNHPKKEWLIDFIEDLTPFKKFVPRKINGTTVLSTIRTNTEKSENGEKMKFHRLILPQENLHENMKWMTEHLLVVFRSPLRLMEIKDFEEPLIHFFEWLQTFQRTIDFIEINGEEISSKSLLFILNNFQVKKELTLYVGLSDNSFEYTQSVDTPSMNIGFPQWGLSNILCSENSVVTSMSSCLTPEDINCLIKHWIGGWNKNLSYLELIRTVEHREVEDEIFETIKKDIEWREHFEGSGRPSERTLLNGGIHLMYDGEHAEIERNDGKIAAFAQFYEQVDGKVLHHFRFQAWDKVEK
ncbi:hypothetical protein CAEBREN_13659 [Caenorhabditis brenneri]|uniref:Sdz-33 F-box domain-containing protein n=1 Tax=Caenorhabditis brenneri TaxID=135651 RepID=G0NDU1_CAEBE|nr:hypothetical protein CAEBREN_13659 [Caenorhabditis brenneri]